MRLTFFTFFVHAAARSLRKSRPSAVALGIALPSLSALFGVAAWIIGDRGATALESISVGQVFLVVDLVVFCGLILWHAIVLSGGQRAIGRYLDELSE